MDLIYIVGGLSSCDRIDLRYSLRSLEKYAKGIDRVIVVGECPYWLSENVLCVKHEQPYPYPSDYRQKHINIMASLKYAIENVDISDEFIVACSDHYLTTVTDYNNYPFYAKLTDTGTELPEEAKNDYTESLVSTRSYLESHNLPTRYMTLHRNMRMIKNAVIDCFQMFDDIINNELSVEPFVLVGNYEIKHYGIKPKPVRDFKIFEGSELWKANPGVTDCFSTAALKYGGLQTLMDGIFNKVCKYERNDGE